MDKKEIAKVLEEIALLLELKAANPFRVRAYRNAARAILSVDEDVDKLIREKRLIELEGIGEDLAEKITALALKGRLPFYEKLKRSIPPGVIEMMHVQGLGGKKVKKIYEKLKVRSIEELKKACLAGKLAKLRGFGTKTEKNILDALEHRESYGKRHLWWDAMSIAAPILNNLKRLKGVKKAEVAGSIRRKMETVGDLDFLVGANHPKPIMDWFTTQPFVERVLAKGPTKSSVRLKGGLQADIRIVPDKQFAFALCYFTGSKEHNIKLRERSKKRGWTLNEWGLTTENRKKAPTFALSKKSIEEKDIYKALGYAYIPPELRENKGEFEAAAKNQIPTLVEEKDIRGTFHNHTTASDGKNTLKEMVAAAEHLGWEYIGIADHSHASFQANGLSEERVIAQIEQIQKLNASKKFRPFVFAGTECDVLPNGSLDFSDALLQKLDYVIISIHSSFKRDEKAMTKRLIKAIEHPLTTMVGHVTGRLLLRREGYPINVLKIIDACIANRKIIELNAFPDRLDMDWRFWHAASDKGLLCCINTDAHSTTHLSYFKAGVNIARKGWLEKKQILNTRGLKDIRQFLRGMRKSYKSG